MSIKARATIEDLYNVPENGKAEIVEGDVVTMSPTRKLPGLAGGETYASLRDYARKTKSGKAFSGNIGFIVDLPNRRSFSPDVAYYEGEPRGEDGDFVEGAPIFVVEIRSRGDYGPAADQKIEKKRADYFLAGTQVVWDVDVLKEKIVRVYRGDDPQNPKVYGRGELADAEPVLPGWTMPVDDLFQ